jgi:hypothetical protein
MHQPLHLLSTLLPFAVVPHLPARFCPLAEPRSLACSSCLIASYLAPCAPVFHVAEYLKNLICTEVQGTFVIFFLDLGLKLPVLVYCNLELPVPPPKSTVTACPVAGY